MTALATMAEVRFGSGQVTGVDSALYLTGSTLIYCHTYGDRPPILAISDAHVKVTVTVPDADQVTEQDVACARRLAEAAARYAAELEQHVAPAAEGPAMPGEAGTGQAAGKAA